jgi:hypothetical protein
MLARTNPSFTHTKPHALPSNGQQRPHRCSSEAHTFCQNDLAIRNTIYVTSGKAIIKAISGVIIIIISAETSTAENRPPPKFSTMIGPVLPSSSDFLRPSPDRLSTLWGAYQRCVSRYVVAVRGPFRPNGRQSLQNALPTAT